MNKVAPILVIIMAVIAWKVYHHQKYSYFDKQPVEQEDLNFNNAISGPIYTDCVNQANEHIRRYFENGRINREKYPVFLKAIKSHCRCYATSPKMIKADQQQQQSEISVQVYNRVSREVLNKCMKKRHVLAASPH